MKFCSKCGKEVREDAEICINCGCRVKNESLITITDVKKTIRFLLTFFLGWLGSFIINHTTLKPNGWKSRTCAYLILSVLTCGIYGLVA